MKKFNKFLIVLAILILVGIGVFFIFYKPESFKNSYLTKIWQTSATKEPNSEILFPEKCLNRFNKTSYCGLAYSGGGARSYAAIIGYLRALNKTGLYSNVDYISTSSSGSWFNGVYSFATSKGISSNELLGESIQLSTMNLDALYNKNDNNTFMGSRINNERVTIREINNSISTKIPINDIWNHVIGKLFLEPYGLNKDVPATLNNTFANDINNVNGTNLDILRLKDTDPFWICNASLFYEFDNSPFSIINFTPMYSGITKTYLIKNELNLGGYVVENYAFGCDLQNNSKFDYVDYSSLVNNYGTFCKNNPFFRTMNNPKSKCFTLRDMMGTSSSKFVNNIALFKLLNFLGSQYNILYKNLNPPTTNDDQCGGLINLNGSCNVDNKFASDSCTSYLGKCYSTTTPQCKADGDCTYNFLNGCTNNKGGGSLNCRMGFLKCTCNKNSIPPYDTNEYKSKSLRIGDSGSLDDLGIISLVARGVNKIVSFVNTQDAKTRIANLFGVKEKNNLSSIVEGLQIFDSVFYNNVLSDFDNCKRTNVPIYSRQKLSVLKNNLYGVKGGYDVDILFLVLEPCLNFINLLPLQLKNLINRFPNSDFIYSSRFTTGSIDPMNMDEGSRLYGILTLSSTQINLISTYTDWCISQPEISRHVNDLLANTGQPVSNPVPQIGTPVPTVEPGKYRNYTDTPGTLVITPCPVGNYCIDGLKIPCPEGTYADVEGLSVPKKCPIGKYQDEKGKQDCKSCPNGTYTDTEGSKMPIKCPKGSFCVSGIRNPVPKGNYQDLEGASDFKKCPVGTYSDKDGQSQCSIPPPGYHQDEIGQSNYKMCDIGNYCINGAKIPCSVGTYAPDKGLSQCLVPPPGYYQDQPAQSSYKICEPGNYCRNGFKQACPMGTSYTKSGGSTCYPDGFYNNPLTNTLTKCDTGYYCINGENIQVPAGTYTNDMGMSVPIPCPKGQYQDEKGKDRCKDAPKGSFVASERSLSATPCEIGQYQDEIGKTSCKLCPIGKYQDETGKDICKDAPPGSYVASQGSVSATQCNTGQYQDESGKDSCKQTPPGYYTNSSGTQTIICPAGSFCINGIKKINPHNTFSGIGQSAPTQCPTNKYSEPGAIECSKTLRIVLTTSNDYYSGTYSQVKVIVKNSRNEKYKIYKGGDWILENIDPRTNKYNFQRGAKDQEFTLTIMNPSYTLSRSMGEDISKSIKDGLVFLELDGGDDWKIQSVQLYYDNVLIRNYPSIDNKWLGNGTASFKGISFINPSKATFI